MDEDPSINQLFNLAWLLKNNLLYGFDLTFDNINVIYELYKNNILDTTKEYDGPTCNYIAIYYQYHKGNEDVSTEYFQRAIKLGSCPAMINYANVLTTKNITKAIELYEMAIECHDTNAMNYLGKIYADGKYGIPTNKEKAIDLFESAILKNNYASLLEYKQICEELGLMERCLQTAYSIYTIHRNKIMLTLLLGKYSDIYIQQKQLNNDIMKRIDKLEKRCQKFKNHFDTKPGGKSYLKAEKHYQLCNNKLSKKT